MNCISTDLPPITDEYIKYTVNVDKQRMPIAFYNAKYFDEPFVALCLSLSDKVSNVVYSDRNEDKNHVDLKIDINDITYSLDIKTITYGHTDKNNTNRYFDCISIGEYVMKANSSLLITCMYKNQIYLVSLKKFSSVIPIYEIQRSKGAFGKYQNIYKFDISDVIANADYIFKIPDFRLTKVYENAMSLYHNYNKFFKDCSRQTKTVFKFNNFLDKYRIELLDVINECNDIYNQIVSMRMIDTSSLTDYDELDKELAALL